MELIIKQKKDGTMYVGTTSKYTVPTLYSRYKRGYRYAQCNGHWLFVPAALTQRDTHVWLVPNGVQYTSKAMRLLGVR